MRIYTRLLVVLGAITSLAIGEAAAHGRPTNTLRRMSWPCGQVSANANAFRNWARLTRVHQSDYAETMRANMGMPTGDSLAVVAVADSTTCAALARTFAQTVAGRDTVTPYPIYALAVDTTLYLLVDFHIDSPKRSDSLSVGSARFYGAAFTHAVTITRATGATRIWEYELVKASATPY